MGAIRKDQAGSATIEFLIWLPVLMFFLLLVVDVSFVLFGKSQALRIIQDANRAVSVGALEVPEAKQFISDSFAPFSSNTTVDMGVVDDKLISTTFSFPIQDLALTYSLPGNGDITITAQHFLEL